MKQTSFLPKLRLDHGGDIRKGKRKIARPFSHKNALHVVFRAHRARGAWSLLTRANEKLVQGLLQLCAERHHIRVYRFVNVGNHIHLLIKTERRQYELAKQDFHRFLKHFGGLVAFEVTGAKKGSAQGGFWEKRVYSRIVSWGREYDGLHGYMNLNFLESKGLPNFRRESWFRELALSLKEAGFAPP